jgi:nucleoside-diphosphate-sugar epimerase
MKNLVIGNTSQLSYYFPDNYEKISSRNIQFTNKRYDRVYICLAEQRTFIQNNKQLFLDTNVDYIINIIRHFSKTSNNIIIYGTSELWNNYDGAIDISTPYDYRSTDYIDSKRLLINIISKLFSNIIILHPFNFNSIYRKEGFLFSKIFDSIINEKKITIGNTYFYRELLHPKFIVDQSIKATSDNIIGSGRLIFVNDFIRTLYSHFNMKYDEFVTEDYKENITSNEHIFYLKSKQILYNNLYEDTISEIEKIKTRNESNNFS